MRSAVLLFVSSFALALVACSDSDEPDTDMDDVSSHMQEHFDKVTEVREALVIGDLEGAHEPATWLAEHPPFADLPPNWERYLDSVRVSALEVLGAEGLQDASYATATMAVACGDCHLQNGIADQFNAPAQPPQEETVRAHMQRHQWALERMWQGLLGPSATAWDEGVSMLADVPLSAHESIDDSNEGDALEQLAKTVHARAAMGFVADTTEKKAQVFGDVLAACGGCHQQAGRVAEQSGP
jgi:cytochrome c553